MQKKPKIERRSYSLIKPLIYLLLQLLIIWELFWILTGEATLTAWSYAELLISFIMLLYFSKKSYEIFKRTPKPNKWDDRIKMERFLNS
jgi:hypothetical protein